MLTMVLNLILIIPVGLSSSDKNGGNALNTEYIKLTKGGESYIQLNSADNANWIELNIVDGSLGFGMKDVLEFIGVKID